MVYLRKLTALQRAFLLDAYASGLGLPALLLHYADTLATEARAFDSIGMLRHAVTASGSHFFSAGALQFFSSRISGKLYGGRLFITSEQNRSLYSDPDPRMWTVRYVTGAPGAQCSVHDLAGFQRFDSLRAAETFARIAAAVLYGAAPAGKVNASDAHHFIAARVPFDAGGLSAYRAMGPIWQYMGALPAQYRDAFKAAIAEHGHALYIVRSYSTPIAWTDGRTATVPNVTYSQTTSGHQSHARHGLQQAGIPVEAQSERVSLMTGRGGAGVFGPGWQS